ncbi:hypothetical protein [Streptacidiphilus fuscans]|uniref:DUF4034 domain-containing protein n=1 Tax=Streptacidiphilus fuscans TaxID=2789292 RepID=A0A931B179_9ACTN|nr:hypothetical protein [Streptacidiphilus fuscans]MBF9066822.1 hypothetical protein [Streptacidiphilus fuscans]
MNFLGRGRRAIPRLTPELDDEALGRVCRQLGSAPAMPGAVDTQVDAVAQLFDSVAGDWDRIGHRMAVLADEVSDPALARSWVMRHPRSADAWLYRARIAYADLRNDGSLSNQAFAAMEDCAQAAALRPEDPTPWVVRLGLCRLLRRPGPEVMAVWREALARDHWNREADLQMLSYLTALDDASFWRVDDFVDRRCFDIPEGSPGAGLELAATLGRYARAMDGAGLGDLLSDRWWQAPRQARLLDRSVPAWTEPGFLRHAGALADLNGLAYALMQANRLRDAGLVFLRIGPVVSSWPWVADGEPLRQFTTCQRQALRFVRP